ncbi:synaptogenesis protein syg-2-like, partial [Saccoglossus kowalevskii]|uniref:Uncharacterized protein LOC102808783 n=1 Tax=Saccoglossus kowalevskii TaxID=10224 RepID=A0ABM0MWU7_SACKO
SPDIVDAVDKVAVDKDEMAVLVCKSDAFPDPQFKWLNSAGGELTNDVEGLQIAEKYEDNLFISTLTIEKVNSAKDYGRYDCMAYNEIGTKSLQIELVPITIPEKPTITETSVTDTTITITWTAGFNGGRPQTFTVKYQNLETLDEAKSTEMKGDGSESYTYTIEGLKADTEYTVWVLATNTKGEQEVKSSVLKTGKTDQNSCIICVGVAALLTVLLCCSVTGNIVAFVLHKRLKRSFSKQSDLRDYYAALSTMTKDAVHEYEKPKIEAAENIEDINYAYEVINTTKSQIIALSLKRRLSDKHSVTEQFIRPNCVNDALEFLQKDNPHYKDVIINADWTDISKRENPEIWSSVTELTETISILIFMS